MKEITWNHRKKIWSEKARKAVYQLQAEVLWKFDRFQTTKIQWKATCVSALTYCNTVLVMSTKLRRKIETAQRQAAKWVLGDPAFHIANEFLEGELGWSSFEEREAKSKIILFKRVEQMAEDRWPKLIYKCAQINNIKLTAVERMRQLKWRFHCEEKDITG